MCSSLFQINSLQVSHSRQPTRDEAQGQRKPKFWWDGGEILPGLCMSWEVECVCTLLQHCDE